MANCIKLIANHSLIMECQAKNQLRLIVKSGQQEIVCRKTTLSLINSFLSQENTTIFKGRLQLSIANKMVLIFAKGALVGQLPATQLSDAVNTIKESNN